MSLMSLVIAGDFFITSTIRLPFVSHELEQGQLLTLCARKTVEVKM